MGTRCFVIMPFRPELTFLYLFIKDHLARSFDIDCERGDDRILTAPLLDKIRAMIKEADFVIADVSGRNPNVYYELGMAHVSEKPVILITHDEIEEAPTDVRAYEFIRYTSDQDAFAAKLSLAVRSIVGGRYDELYEVARTIFQEFCTETGVSLPERSKDDFLGAAFVGFRAAEIPDPEDHAAVARRLAYSIHAPPMNLDTVAAFNDWVSRTYPRPLTGTSYGSAWTVVPISAHS